MTGEAERAAVAAFPALQRLLDLRDVGWQFQRTEVEVRGFRTWPGAWADAIAVRYTSDAFGVRVDLDGGVVWRKEGSLLDVVDGLLALPTPGDQFAPRLVLGGLPGLWTP